MNKTIKLTLLFSLTFLILNGCNQTKENITMLQTKTKAPDFELQDQNGKTHKLSDYKGSKVLVYFYPKDDTPGCTKEACSIRDAHADFSKLNLVILGISSDSVESHKKFAEKYNLPFILLADTDKKVIKAYDADGLFTKRISYLINEEGDIVKEYPNVDPNTHAAQIYEDIK